MPKLRLIMAILFCIFAVLYLVKRTEVWGGLDFAQVYVTGHSLITGSPIYSPDIWRKSIVPLIGKEFPSTEWANFYPPSTERAPDLCGN